jgi:hypothetical protein
MDLIQYRQNRKQDRKRSLDELTKLTEDSGLEYFGAMICADDDFKVVLDACVLYPQTLRDLLLRLALEGLYAARFSERILEEVRFNLVSDGRATEANGQVELYESGRGGGPLRGVPRQRRARWEKPCSRHPSGCRWSSSARRFLLTSPAL